MHTGVRPAAAATEAREARCRRYVFLFFFCMCIVCVRGVEGGELGEWVVVHTCSVTHTNTQMFSILYAYTYNVMYLCHV